MVLPASHGVPRAPWYSGAFLRAISLSPTGLLPSVAGLPRPLRLDQWFLTLWRYCNTSPKGPSTPYAQLLQDLTRIWFGLLPVRSPLLRESFLLSFPRGTKMFQFPRLAPTCLFYSAQGDETLLPPGCPIRVSPGLSLLAAHRSFSQLATPFFAS